MSEILDELLNRPVPPKHFRHNNGFICSGTLRIAREDFDTAPTDAVKKEYLDALCDTGNQIASLAEQLASMRSDINSLRGAIKFASYGGANAYDTLRKALEATKEYEQALQPKEMT